MTSAVEDILLDDLRRRRDDVISDEEQHANRQADRVVGADHDRC